MKQIEISVEWLLGFVVGFEWVPKGTVDENTYLVFDVGILRVLVSFD